MGLPVYRPFLFYAWTGWTTSMVDSVGIGLGAYNGAALLPTSGSTIANPPESKPKASQADAVHVEISAAALDSHRQQLSAGLYIDPGALISTADFYGDEADPDALLNTEELARVDQLFLELDNIFGAPDITLSADDQVKEIELLNAIDRILGIAEPGPLTPAQQRKFDALAGEIDKLFEDGTLSDDEAVKLKALDDRIEKLFSTIVPKELTQADEQQLEELFAALDSLYGAPPPSKEQLVRSEEVFEELDQIYGGAAERAILSA
jgi:hypothetical protein